jgi:hypothetical protein
MGPSVAPCETFAAHRPRRPRADAERAARGGDRRGARSPILAAFGPPVDLCLLLADAVAAGPREPQALRRAARAEAAR